MVYENAPLPQRRHRRAVGPDRAPHPRLHRRTTSQTDMRDVVDAILYILRTGCQCRYLPIDFPPKRPSGGTSTGRARWHPRPHPRPAPPQGPHVEKPYHPRTSSSFDSQSVNTTSDVVQLGRDNCKNVDAEAPYRGRQPGLLLAVLVTPRRDDARAPLFARWSASDGQGRADVRRQQVHNFKLYEWSRRTRVGAVHRASSRAVRGLGEAADPLDGRADLRVAGQCRR